MSQQKSDLEEQENFKSQKQYDRNVALLLATQKSREAFDGYRKKTSGRFLTILSAGLGLSLIVNVIQATRPIPTRYIYADANGRISPLTALSSPNMKDSDVSVWVTNAITSALSFDYVKYREQIQDAQKYFTPNGWDGFQQMLQGPHLLEQVTDNHLIMTISPTQAPTLLSAGTEGNLFTWRFSIPMVIKFYTNNPQAESSGISDHPVIVQVTVTRLPETMQSSALGISRIFIQEN